MLGFLEKVRLRRAVAKRLRLARLDNLPRSYINTVRFQLGRGAVHGALLTAQEGLSRFPQSDELSRLHRFSVRRLASPARRALEAECAADGGAGSIARLVRLHIECGDYEEALEWAVSMSGVEEHRLSLRLRGEAHVRRFFQEGAADDARDGIDLLERSIDDVADEFEVVWLLAQVHEHIGVISRSLLFVYRALNLDSSHAEALELHTRLTETSLQTKELDEALKCVELESRFARGAVSALVFDERVLRSQLVRFSLVRGVRRVFYEDSSNLLTAAMGQSSKEPTQADREFCERALDFRSSVDHGMHRMGLGTFQRAALDLGDCHLALFSIGSGVLVVESASGARTEMIRTECDDLLASWSQQGEELVHA